MPTIHQLRRLAAECRSDREKAPVDPDTLDALLDIATRHDLEGLLGPSSREEEPLSAH